MKNRRLNILFVAIMALAAAPQALQDANRLANAAQQRVEDEFWSVFLSSQMPEANSRKQMDAPLKQSGAAELVADAGASAAQNCPLERVVENVEQAASQYKMAAQSSAKPSRLTRRAAEKAQAEASEPQWQDVEDPQVASLDAVRRVEIMEREKSALETARLHSRETEKIADATSRSSLASFAEGNENLRIKIKQATEMDKQLRERTRYMMDVPGQGLPAPNPMRSM